MVVSMKGQTVGIMSTLVMTGAEAHGAGEAPVVTASAVLHRSKAGVLDKGGTLDMGTAQTLGREQPMRTDGEKKFTPEVIDGKEEAARVVVGVIKGTRVGRHTPRPQG